MDIQAYETLILNQLKIVTEKILYNNPQPNISAKSRAGAEISSLLEEEFVKETANHLYFKDSLASPKGETKNPWDALTYFEYKDHREVIWIDFKAVKVSSKASNPDIGAADKLIKLITNNNGFYLVYIFVYYTQTELGLKFVPNKNAESVKLYFLKDIHSSFRRNTKNQLQINIDKEPENRTRQDFIEMLLGKIIQGYTRQKNIAERELTKYNQNKIRLDLTKLNKEQEDKIRNL
ncbi:MAG: hypothetical protein EAZ53_01345 [Bacteroidetes bacterium]|nr:MAG: hypothetical protein EAZ53_01345 [Bacteroidota bacterium]